MPEHEQLQATVKDFIPVTLGGGNQLVNFGGNEVLSLVYRFV